MGVRTHPHKRGQTRVNDYVRSVDVPSVMRHLLLTMVVLAMTSTSGCGSGGGGGGPWRSYPSDSPFGLNAVWAFAPDDVWAGGQNMLHFDGSAFTPVPMPQAGFVTDFLGFAPNDLYAVAGSSLLHWDGAAWSAVDFGGTIDPSGLTAVWGTSADNLWLGDDSNGRVHRWNGSAWTTSVTQVVQVTDIWGSSPDDVYVSGIFGMAHWTGGAFTSIDDFLVDHSDGLWGSGPADVWAVSQFGTLAHWDGATWTDTLPIDNDRFQEDHSKVWGTGTGDVWAVGSFGAVSHWDGSGWSQTQIGDFPYHPFMNAVHGSTPGDVWAVGYTSDGENTGVIVHLEP